MTKVDPIPQIVVQCPNRGLTITHVKRPQSTGVFFMDAILAITEYMRGFGFSDWVILAGVIIFLAYRAGYVDRLAQALPWFGMLFSVRQQARLESAQDLREHEQEIEAATLEYRQTQALLTQQNETYLLQAVVDTSQQQAEFIQSLATEGLTRQERLLLEVLQNQLEIIRMLRGGGLTPKDTQPLKATKE